MKNRLIIASVSILLLVFIVGCAQQPPQDPPVPQEQPAPEVQPAPEAAPEPPAEEPAEEEKAPAPPAEDVNKPELPDSFKELLKVAERKVKSYTYFYSGPPNNQGGNTFHIVGNKIRVDITQSDITLRLPYDTVYIDREFEYAVGYCLGNKIRCPEGPLQYEINFDEFYEPIPGDWLEIIEYGEVSSSQNIDNRKTKGVVFDRGGLKYIIYIDTFSGIPMRVTTTEGDEDTEKRYHYQDLQINTVSASDVEPPRGYFE